MWRMWRKAFATIAVASSLAHAAIQTSIFDSLPPDDNAIDARPGKFGLVGDGVADDTIGLMLALNATYGPGTTNCTQPGHRVVYLGPGRYRVTSTIDMRIWQRLIGWGPSRPTLVLASTTPGFGDRSNPTPMLRANWYAPGAYTPENSTDGGNIAFGVGIMNVNFEVQPGNPGAVALRWRVAQGGVLRAVAMNLSADTLAGIHCPGWAQQDVAITGGQFAALVHSTGAWPSSYRDCEFSGQAVACVGTSEEYPSWDGSGFVRVRFANAPVAFTALQEGYPSPSQLWSSTTRAFIKDSVFSGIRTALFVLLNVTDQPSAGFTVLNSVADESCSRTVLALLQPGLQNVTYASPGPYILHSLHVGMDVKGLESAIPSDPSTGLVQPVFTLDQDIQALQQGQQVELPPSDIPALPTPVSSWMNAAAYGVLGDGVTDVTQALQTLLNQAASSRPAGSPVPAAVFLPTGVYMLNDTVSLPPGVTLFGLHCFDVTLRLFDAAAPSFKDPSSMKAIVAVAGQGAGEGQGQCSPWLRIGGLNIQSAATYAGASPPTGTGANPNPGAIGLLWTAYGQVQCAGAAEGGLLPAHGLSDVFFHPATFPDNPHVGTGPSTELSLVVQGGTGVFTDIWSCNSYADGGARVMDAPGPGVFYQLSDEHHGLHEVWLRNVSGWAIWTVQTEDRAEAFAGANVTIPILCEVCHNVTIGGLYTNRGPGLPPLPALVVDASSTGFTALHTYGFPWGRLFNWNASVVDLSTGHAAPLATSLVTVR